MTGVVCHIYIYIFFFVLLTHQISSKMLHRMCYYKMEIVKDYPNIFTKEILKLRRKN
jgi:hypothetical protein